MPRYDYQCERCGEVIEVRKHMDEPGPAIHIRKAPRHPCGGRLEQVIHAPVIRFVGSGFYVNDYGKGTK
jgi:putative FmdB family regulatory protein